MKQNHSKLKIIIILFVILFCLCGYWVLYLRKAHSTFENYYKFRGCTELLKQAEDYGLCKISSGQTIKIVKYQGKWFLDGDLPNGFLSF
ncbi:MAG: hypothetical protein NTW50_03895 [Candidatus Berkelbacteria bacterium]|nr:hypothetical protein [Candidatus Berkelbacteria bacterium]